MRWNRRKMASVISLGLCLNKGGDRSHAVSGQGLGKRICGSKESGCLEWLSIFAWPHWLLQTASLRLVQWWQLYKPFPLKKHQKELCVSFSHVLRRKQQPEVFMYIFLPRVFVICQKRKEKWFERRETICFYATDWLSNDFILHDINFGDKFYTHLKIKS